MHFQLYSLSAVLVGFAFNNPLAQPFVSAAFSDQLAFPTATAHHGKGLFHNYGSGWNKRNARRSPGRLARPDTEENKKRYWKVTSQWIDDEEENRASAAVHRMTTTITITVDAPTETAAETSQTTSTTRDASVSTSTSTSASTPSASSTSSISAIASAKVTSSALSSNTSNTTIAQPMTTSIGPSNGKLVFAHFMVGIVSTYAIKDWIFDMTLAKSYGIDGFALNIGKDSYTDAQLALAYEAAKEIGFKVFISFDFNWFSISDTQPIVDLVNKYVVLPAQFKLPGTDAAYVSSFSGDGFSWEAVRQSTGKNIYVVPNWQPQSTEKISGVQGLFSWYAWPSENNRPVNKAMDTDADVKYINAVAGEQKVYMAPISPWFFTHFGKEVPYSKNWLFLSETLWYDRWQQILELQKDLQYIEIVTWNDYGESHNVGPYDTPHTDDGSSKWAKDMPHDAMLEFAKPYITAFKTGWPTPIIQRDMLIYWHRPTLKNVECDASDNCGSKPEGWEMLKDEVFVATFARAPGKVQVTSGGNAVFEQNIPVGVTMIRVPMAPGQQDFHFTTDAGTDVKVSSAQTVRSSCINGIYNYNFISGMLLAT